MENNDKTVKQGRPYNIHTYRDKEEAERVTKRLKNIYMLNTQWFCNTYQCAYIYAGKRSHLNTKKHIRNAEADMVDNYLFCDIV